MALSRAKIESRLRPYLLLHLNEQLMASLDDADFIETYNRVAHDLNELAHLNVERYYKKTGSDNAEDAGLLNYLVQGKIAKIYSFKYTADDWRTRKYSYVDDRILLAEISDGVQMDIRYLRRCEDVTALADEIDLPFSTEDAYLELLKVRMRQDYGDSSPGDYETALDYYKGKTNRLVDRRITYERGVRRNWFDQKGDDNVYEIIHNYVGMENFLLGVDTNYTYLGGNA